MAMAYVESGIIRYRPNFMIRILYNMATMNVNQTPKVKRSLEEMSSSNNLPPVKIIKRSPKERRDEITGLIEQYINPIKRELGAKTRELEEIRTELNDLKVSKTNTLTGITSTELDGVKFELKVRTVELGKIKTELEELKDIKLELMKVRTENAKLGEQQKKQERQNRRSNLRMRGFIENKWETPADCRKIVLNMLQHAGIPLPPLAIELAHMVGVKQKHSERAIVVKFLHMGDRDDVLLRQEPIYRNCCITVELHLHDFHRRHTGYIPEKKE